MSKFKSTMKTIAELNYKANVAIMKVPHVQQYQAMMDSIAHAISDKLVEDFKAIKPAVEQHSKKWAADMAGRIENGLAEYRRNINKAA